MPWRLRNSDGEKADIIVDGDDIFGDGVNVAARLEGIAPAGGICVSDVVHQQVGGRVEAAFTDLGEQDLKNIARPIRVYSIQLDSRARATKRKESLGKHTRRDSSLDEKPKVLSLRHKVQVRGPRLRTRLCTVQDAIRLIDQNLPPELATQPRWTFARVLLVEAIKTGKSRDLTTATRQFTQALRNERWLVSD